MEKGKIIRVWMGLATMSVLLAASGCEQEKDRLDAEARRLCQQDGGVKAYETVNLPSNRFDKFGGLSIPNKEKARPEDDYFYEWDVQYLRKGNPELLRSHHRLIRRKDEKVLGESVRYIRRGGDLPGPWHESSFSCPEVADQVGLERLVFQKE